MAFGIEPETLVISSASLEYVLLIYGINLEYRI